jgi:hypothetical protein
MSAAAGADGAAQRPLLVVDMPDNRPPVAPQP